MLNISCNSVTTILKVKNSMVVWVQNGGMCIVVAPWDHMADGELRLNATATVE